jgi:hypothetical protein
MSRHVIFILTSRKLSITFSESSVSKINRMYVVYSGLRFHHISKKSSHTALRKEEIVTGKYE